MRLKDTRTNGLPSRLATAPASTEQLEQLGKAWFSEILIRSLTALREARDELNSNGSDVLALKVNHSVREIKTIIEAVTGKPAPRRPGDRTDEATPETGA